MLKQNFACILPCCNWCWMACKVCSKFHFSTEHRMWLLLSNMSLVKHCLSSLCLDVKTTNFWFSYWLKGILNYFEGPTNTTFDRMHSVSILQPLNGKFSASAFLCNCSLNEKDSVLCSQTAQSWLISKMYLCYKNFHVKHAHTKV